MVHKNGSETELKKKENIPSIWPQVCLNEYKFFLKKVICGYFDQRTGVMRLICQSKTYFSKVFFFFPSFKCKKGKMRKN